jgi:hypothetical protein
VDTKQTLTAGSTTPSKMQASSRRPESRGGTMRHADLAREGIDRLTGQ